ncbi:MAG: hypothetical protein GC159_19040 [Phycisphaera sp.]|nr:hypothetical protein [Phycisphaera sp.]
MGSLARTILPTLRLMRIGLVFTAVSNIWLVALLGRAMAAAEPDPNLASIIITPELRALPLGAVLGCTAAVAIGMYVFGMVLNDVMDVRRDRTFAPDRPLPSGQLGVGGAVAIAVIALLVSIAGSVPLGRWSTGVCLLCAVLVVFYNTLGKHLPGVGVLTLGLIRGAHMLVANPVMGFVWPAWVTVSHVVGISAASYRLELKRPRLAGGQLWTVIGGWAFVTAAMMAWMNTRGTLMAESMPWIWVGPLASAVVFITMGIRIGSRRGDNPKAAGGKLMKWGLLWLIVYDASWFAAAQLWWQAGVAVALAAAAWGSMALLRHLNTATAPLPSFQREPQRN